ncbi:MAG: hypothetical protein E6J13_04155 [Chloroflexi bacterium]|nr:MAG: hypothetical protein E6J13_04155 [Chloroflexota bacterium]
MTAVLVLILSAPASASSSVASDARGDIATTAPAYLDIVHTKATLQVGRDVFLFQTVNAAPVPAAPAGFRAWNWLIDLPGGVPIEYALTVRFCSHLIQRTCVGDAWHWESSMTNMMTGAQVSNAFAFEVDQESVKAWVPRAFIQSPTGFMWVAATRDSPAAGNTPPVDLVPDDPSTSELIFGS